LARTAAQRCTTGIDKTMAGGTGKNGAFEGVSNDFVGTGEAAEPQVIIALDKTKGKREKRRRTFYGDEEKHPQTKEKIFCLCKKPAHGSMIQCEVCKLWLHCSCVGLTLAHAKKLSPFLCAECFFKTGGLHAIYNLSDVTTISIGVNTKSNEISTVKRNTAHSVQKNSLLTATH